ncbi:MAG TPA: hypothetical protein VGC16_07165, partial [Rhizomicrobium sp.]
WLAFQIARSHSIHDKGAGKPLGFWQAAAFQWINPKAWLMAVGAISAYTDGAHLFVQVAIIAFVTLGVTLASTLTWTAFGAGIRRWLKHPWALRLFNLAMALLLVISVVPILGEIRDSLR